MAIKRQEMLIYKDTNFWKRQLNEMLSDAHRAKWEKVGKGTEQAYNRRLKGKKDTSKDVSRDLVNFVSTLGGLQATEIFYNDPVPIVKSHRQEHRHLEKIWTKLLAATSGHNEFLHQQMGTHFVNWGVGVVKIVPEPDGIGFVVVRPDDIVFDKHWVKFGGEPETRAVIIGERIEKTLADLRNVGYTSNVVENLIETKRKPEEPLEVTTVEIWEFNIRIDNQWHMATWSQDAIDLLQWDINPINEPSYAFLLIPGTFGLNSGKTAEIKPLDDKINQIYKRAMDLASNRMTGFVYDKNRVDAKTLQSGKNAVPLIGVEIPEGQSIKDIAYELKMGVMDKADGGPIDTGREYSQWQMAGSPGKLSTPGKTITATETQYIAGQEMQQSAPKEKLVDRYLDRLMYVSALWLKYMSDMRNYDPFTVLDPEEFDEIINWLPSLSEDLQEFQIGVEPGSTFMNRNIETIQQVDHLFEQLERFMPLLNQMGKTLDWEKLLFRYFRALHALGPPEDLIVDIQETQQPGMQGAQGMMPQGMGMEGMGGGMMPPGMEMPEEEMAPEAGGEGRPDIMELLGGLQ